MTSTGQQWFPRDPLFWGVHVLGWLALLTALMFVQAIAGRMLGLTLWGYLVWFVASTGSCLVFRRWVGRHERLRKTVMPVVGFCALFAGLSGIAVAAIASVEGYFRGRWEASGILLFGGLCIGVQCAWVAGYVLVLYNKRAYRRKLDRIRREYGLKEAHLNALVAQVKAGSGVTGVNKIEKLIRENESHAREVVIAVSKVLKFSIRGSGAGKVRLDEELQMLRYYTALVGLQNPARLCFFEAESPSVGRCLLPPAALQILVENAIRHGSRPDSDYVEVSVRAERWNRRLRCEVRNEGVLPTPLVESQSRQGLLSLRRRLDLLYDGRAVLRLRQEAGQVVAMLELPCETG